MGFLGLIVIVWFAALAAALAGFVQAVQEIREQRDATASRPAVPRHGFHPLAHLHLRHVHTA